MTDHVYPTAEPLEAAVIAALEAKPTTQLEKFLQHTVRGLAAGISGKDPNAEVAALAEAAVNDAWVDSAEDTGFPYDDKDDEDADADVAGRVDPAEQTDVAVEAGTLEAAADEDEWLTGAACSREDPECEACQ